jgi:TolB-like protein
MVDVFVSYASEDRDRIAPLVAALEEEGWSVWWDQHIHAGPDFRAAIEDALASCRVLVVAWSAASVASDFVIDEASAGRSRHILVPLQLDDVQIPLGFRTAQTAQMQQWPETDQGLDKLIAGVRSTLEGRPGPVQAPRRAARPPGLALGIAGAVVISIAAAVLYTLQTDPETESRNRIAVLPLKSASPESSESYLLEGLHEALISNLSKVSALRVISPGSARRVDRDLPTPEIAHTLGVAYMVEGSVQREGDQIRVIVQLVDGVTGGNLWSETYDRKLERVLALQAEITRTIARQISVVLTPEDEKNVSAIEHMRPDTYEAYLRGMFELRKESLRGYRTGIRIMRDALTQDPDSALAHAGVAIGYSMLGHNFFPETALPKAREAALKALALDDSLAEVHLAMGMYKLYFEWNWADAEYYLLRSLTINPSLVDAHYHYAWLLELLREDEKALEHGETTRDLSPLSPFYNGWLADQYRAVGHHEQAIAQAHYTISLNERYPLGWFALGNTHADLSNYDQAITAHEHLRDSYFWSWALGGTFAKAGQIDAAREIALSIEQEADNAIPLVLISAALGEKEAMYEWLDAARESRLAWYPWLVAWFPATQPYRHEPRMQALAAELDLTPKLVAQTQFNRVRYPVGRHGAAFAE